MKFFLGGQDEQWSLTGIERPWPADRKPLFSFVREHTSEDGTYDGAPLPDEEWADDWSGLRFAPGLFDRIMISHEAEGEPERKAERLVRDLNRLLARSTADRLRDLYRDIVEKRLSDVLPLVAGALAGVRVDPRRAQAIARVLITEAPDRDVVKLGIVMLTATEVGTADLELLARLGRHEEFVRYVLPAFHGRGTDWERIVWDIAKSSSGWGRVEAVGLLDGCMDPEIKGWLRREGWRNSVGFEGSALVCARTGGLLDMLTVPSEEAFDLVDRLVDALIMGEYAGGYGLGHYGDGAEVTEKYLELLESRSPSLRQLVAADGVRTFLTHEELFDAELVGRGWGEPRRARMIDACDRVIERPGWEEMTAAALSATDEGTQWQGVAAASVIGVATWDFWWRRVREASGLDGWYGLSEIVDDEHIDEVVAFAEQRFPLDSIGSGPGDELGLGPDFQAHGELGFLLGALERFPGRGWTLLRAGIASPVTRNRWGAARALGRWPDELRSPEVREAILTAWRAEPTQDLKEALLRLSRGEDVDPDGDEDW